MKSEMSAVAHALLPELLAAIPPLTELEPYRDRNLNAWRSKGAHSLYAANSSSFVVQVNAREYGATLFAEAQHLLNHVAEQRAHLVNSLATGAEPSPSWLFVTLYYMSLYAAMAMTRAANSAVVYLDRDAVRQYCGLAAKVPPGGAFELQSYIDPTTAISFTSFKKCGTSHFHEAVWISIHALASRVETQIAGLTTNRKATDDEVLALRGLRLFKSQQFRNPLVWQSKLRNGINYRPGFSYRSVVKNNLLRVAARLAKQRLSTLGAAIEVGERAKARMHRVIDPFDSLDDCIDLLISQTLFIESSTESTLTALCDHYELTCSAFSARKAFGRANRKVSSIIDLVG